MPKTTINLPLVALDSTCIIDVVQEDNVWWPELEPVIRDAERGKIQILICDVSMAECTHIKKFDKSGISYQEGVEKVRAWFDNGFIVNRPADDRIAKIAAGWIREQKLETCDGLIAATAAFYKAHILYTRDGLKPHADRHKKLLALDEKLIYEHRPLAIKPPSQLEYVESVSMFQKA